MRSIFIIKKPLITEKATDLSGADKYVFVVESSATKNEVRKAVYEIYRVTAAKVNIVNLPGKPRRFRGLKRRKGGMKKAVVTLKAGQKIDIK